MNATNFVAVDAAIAVISIFSAYTLIKLYGWKTGGLYLSVLLGFGAGLGVALEVLGDVAKYVLAALVLIGALVYKTKRKSGN